MIHLLSTLFPLFVLQAVSQLTCDDVIMGTPHLSDCNKAYDNIPYALAPYGGDSDMDRLFIEPQYLRVPFGPVFNLFSEKSLMVQLPKIWRYGTLARSSLKKKLSVLVGSIVRIDLLTRTERYMSHCFNELPRFLCCRYCATTDRYHDLEVCVDHRPARHPYLWDAGQGKAVARRDTTC